MTHKEKPFKKISEYVDPLILEAVEFDKTYFDIPTK